MKALTFGLIGPVELLVEADEPEHQYVATVRDTAGELVRIAYDAIVDRGRGQRPPAGMVPACQAIMPDRITNLSRT